MRVDLLDPPAYSPPYDHALATALAQLGVDVRLVTSPFAYGPVPEPEGYTREEIFYRHVHGAAGSKVRTLGKLAAHGGDMRRYRRSARDLVHVQWLTVPRVDLRLLPERPTVLTIHDPLERGDRRGGRGPIPASAFARIDAIVVHSQFARGQVIAQHGLEPERVHVIRHGALKTTAAFSTGLTPQADVKPAKNVTDSLPPELGADAETDLPVVLCFGLIRPYKGTELLLEVWRGITDAELWIVGRPMVDLEPLIAAAPDGVRFVPRFVTDAEEEALFARADIVVLPYERSERFGFSGVLATALGDGKAIVLSDVGGFSELGELDPADPPARIVTAGDAGLLHAALADLIADPAARARLGQAARRAAEGQFSWAAAAQETLALYEKIAAK
jgi:glycosyltransferase involved in cell wall biosynthesis